ncbi:Virulence protein RhuM family protein [Lachnospiraceae bacterium XBB1006]|nr:Virulence protein RhuM family protein [Lachnospiraceae bacterium XBB1006]
MMGVLYDVGKSTINYHLHKLYEDGEIEENSVVRKFRTTADDERLKKGGSILTKEYFEQFYATLISYDSTAKETKRFFAAVQNKLHYAVHGQTVAEVIYNRADAEKEHMGLTTWEGSPNSKIHKYDVTVAKNYLTEEELAILSRMVTAYLDYSKTILIDSWSWKNI